MPNQIIIDANYLDGELIPALLSRPGLDAGNAIYVSPGESIQDAIDETCGAANPATTVRNAGPAVVLLDGIHLIDAPIRADSVIGLQIIGSGFVQIRPTVDMPAALILNGTAYSRFGGFTVRGQTDAVKVDDAIHVMWDQATSARSSTINTFRDIVIRNLDFTNGVRIGKEGAGNQCDNTSWYNITISGSWVRGGGAVGSQVGMFVGDSVFANNLVHNAYKMTLGGVRYAIRMAQSEFSVDGLGVDRCETAVIGATTRFCSYKNSRMEDTERIFESGGPATYPTNTSFENINYKANEIATDGKIVYILVGGLLRMSNVSLSGFQPSGPVPKIDVATPTALAQVIVDGLVVGGSNYSPASPSEVFTLATGNHAVVRGFVTVGTNGSVAAIADYDSRP